MELVSPREVFLQHLQLVAAVSPTRSPKPIFKDVLIEAHDDSVTLTATDGDVTIRTSYEAGGVAGSGSTALPAATLLSAVRSLNGDDIKIEPKGAYHELTGGSSVFKLKGDEPDAFPVVEPMAEGERVEVPLQAFLQLAQRTMFAAAREMGRYAFNGVLLEVGGSEITLVATDGRRLSLAGMKLETDAPAGTSVILPIKGLTQLQRAAADQPDDAKVAIQVDGNRVALSLGTTEIYAQLVEGEFPNFRAVVPAADQVPNSVDIVRADFEDAIRRASVTAGEESRSIQLRFDNDSLTISSRHEGVGESQSTMPIAYSGEIVEIRFNPDYIGDYLKHVPDSSLTFRFKDRASAGCFTTAEENTYIIMPITS